MPIKTLAIKQFTPIDKLIDVCGKRSIAINLEAGFRVCKAIHLRLLLMVINIQMKFALFAWTLIIFEYINHYIRNGWQSKRLIMQRPVLKAIWADGYMYFYVLYLCDASIIYFTGWKSSATLYQSTTWWTALCLHYNCISHLTLQFPSRNDPIGISQNIYQIFGPIQRILNSVWLPPIVCILLITPFAPIDFRDITSICQAILFWTEMCIQIYHPPFDTYALIFVIHIIVSSS